MRILAGSEPYQGFPHLSELAVRGTNLGVGGERELLKLYRLPTLRGTVGNLAWPLGVHLLVCSEGKSWP